jgi:hypothetical protein
MTDHEHRIIDEELMFAATLLGDTVRAYLDGVMSRVSLEYALERLEDAQRESRKENEADPMHHAEYVRDTLAVLDAERVIHG